MVVQAAVDEYRDVRDGAVELVGVSRSESGKNPRGLRFGPDEYLYVAEGGIGGSDPACGVVPAVGPYTRSATGGRISRIDRHGHRSTVTDALPSSQTSMASGSLISGVADIAFIDGKMYALLAGAGCSHGVTKPNGIARIHRDGTWELIANLSAFQQANPVKNPNPGDFEPDGTWWSMVAVHDDLYAVEPNHGELDKITLNGKISRVLDISASQGHVVPTSIAHRGNDFYVSNLGTFDPDQLNTQSIFEISPSGHLRVLATGLSKVLGLAFDERGRLYVLEASYSTTDPGPEPATGRLLRISHGGKQEVLIDSTSGLLTFPTGMTFGPDGALYISNVGFGPPPIGLGQILRVQFRDDDD
ncbi:MAG: ScyD/ScyE family protein [Pseudomonadota bacterium]|nr:ScyD/ScyE family protein [Pseudomonadota bacterium]